MVTKQATALAVNKIFPGQVCLRRITAFRLPLLAEANLTLGSSCRRVWIRQLVQCCNKVDSIRVQAVHVSATAACHQQEFVTV